MNSCETHRQDICEWSKEDGEFMKSCSQSIIEEAEVPGISIDN